MDCLADIVVNAATFAHRGDDGGKVVVLKHHIRGALGDVRARDAHAHADVGALDAGRVVDAVAGHSGDISFLFPSGDDPHLMLGLYSGVNGILRDLFLKFFVA